MVFCARVQASAYFVDCSCAFCATLLSASMLSIICLSRVWKACVEVAAAVSTKFNDSSP